jgi:hypothetical protein
VSVKDPAAEFRAEVVDYFQRTNALLAAELKKAKTATDFHAILKKLFNACDPDEPKDPVRLRLLHYLHANKQFVFDEQGIAS